MTTTRVRRRDALPESLIGFGNFRDDGCSVAPSCLACPLPQCRYDVPGGARIMLNEVRDTRIAQAHAAGASVDDLAATLQISRRTVFRVLEGR